MAKQGDVNDFVGAVQQQCVEHKAHLHRLVDQIKVLSCTKEPNDTVTIIYEYPEELVEAMQDVAKHKYEIDPTATPVKADA